MEPTTIVKRAEGVLSTNIDGEAVLMTVESGNYFSLNPVGSVIWSLLEKPTSLESVQEILLDRFSGDREAILSGSRAYLQDLTTRGLVNQSTNA